jgi:hypothetical protein
MYSLRQLKLGKVVHICNPSIQEAEAGESQVPELLGLNCKTLSQPLPKEKEAKQPHGCVIISSSGSSLDAQNIPPKRISLIFPSRRPLEQADSSAVKWG